VLWDGELLEESIGFVTGGLGTLAGGTGVAEFLYKGSKVGPDIFPLDYREGFVEVFTLPHQFLVESQE
jgi:hypothetical protein